MVCVTDFYIVQAGGPYVSILSEKYKESAVLFLQTILYSS